MRPEDYVFPKGKTCDNLCVEPTDNGGAIVRFTVYTPSSKISQTTWDDKTFSFGEQEDEAAINFAVKVLRHNFEMKKNKMNKKKK